MSIGFVIFPTVVKGHICQHKQYRRGVPTCRRLARQNWLPCQIVSCSKFFIEGVNAIIRVAIRPPVVECDIKKNRRRHRNACRAG